MDISQSVWNEADASNNTAAPDGAPEGMAPSGVNDTMRADRGAIKRWYNHTIPLLTGGTPIAFTLSYSVAPALADGMTHLVQFNAANGNNATLNVNGLGAKPLYSYGASGWAQVPAGAITTNMISPVTYDAGAGVYRIQHINGVGSWTPVDGSGAGLAAFTGVSANYQVIGNLVYAYFILTYPVNASGANAVIGGLPLTTPNASYIQIPAFLDTHGNASGGFLRPVLNTTIANIINSTGTAATNSNMSGLTISALLTYPLS
jgi:hypothetical protein